jgi:hypothetical protein
MSLSAQQAMAMMFDPAVILTAQGMTPDAWQRAFLLNQCPQTLLNCTRQAGKSTVVAALALHTALFKPNSLSLILAPSQRQAHELFRKVLDGYNAVGRPVAPSQDNQSMSRLELVNGSRIIGLPGKEGTIRGYSKVDLLLIDEGSRVPDDLYRSVRPMLAVSKGRLVGLSTPFGQRGWFYEEWTHGTAFQKVKVAWTDVPRITPEFIATERASLGDAWVQQEYECLFTALEGLVYPEFEGIVWDVLGPIGHKGRPVGGIDFGWRNPFAAVLTIWGERYLRETPLSEHRAALKALGKFQWFADPAGPDEIHELRAADLKVSKGDNAIRHGIAAVTARIRTKRLRVSRLGCPNLCAEARLYRYPSGSERHGSNENPVDDNNHALAALRYLVSRIDARFIARLRRKGSPSGEGIPEAEIDATLGEAKAAGERARARARQSIWGNAGDTFEEVD